jgi:DNA invertase Pin-like site-specific DNA recombinase
MTKHKRAALYMRVSTDRRRAARLSRCRGLQRCRHQRRQRRDQRPRLDALLKDASRRKFEVVMAWAIDRLRRSLIGTIEQFEAAASISASTSRSSTPPHPWASSYSR